MNSGIMMRLGACLLTFAFCLYSYLDKQNQLTSLRIKLPSLAAEINNIKEENRRIQYEIDQFENPMHLMELSRSEEYFHLKHPVLQEVLCLQEGVALQERDQKELDYIISKPYLPVAVGAK